MFEERTPPHNVRGVAKVLKDYYAKADKSHGSADGAGSGIIGLLEVCESDFTKGLTEMTAAEETAANDHEAYSKQDQIDTAAKSQDVKYKETFCCSKCTCITLLCPPSMTVTAAIQTTPTKKNHVVRLS